MTEQRRREICAELARRMGYKEIVELWEGTVWHDPSGNRCDKPDFFTNAEDKDALVAWLAADWVLWKRFFLEFTALIIPAMMQSEDYLGRIGETDNYTIGPSKAEWGWALMTAPRETITLAAARALGIGEEE